MDAEAITGLNKGDSDIPTLVPDIPSHQYSYDHIKVPVTILTGFLGAGKSTLLGRILKEKHGWKIAVLMNEVGPNNSVDKALMWQKNGSVGDEWLEVENGCLCCTAKNETFLALESLLKRRPDIEHVVIEASGAADPANLLEKLWIDEALESRLILDGVVTVVDCSSALEMLSPESPRYSVEAARQVAVADCLLLNKIDLKADTIPKIKDVVDGINPFVQVWPTSYADVDLERIFGLSKYHRVNDSSFDDIKSLLKRANSISLTSHPVDNRIRSFSVKLIKAPEFHAFERWLFTLLWEKRIGTYSLNDNEDILRVKGVVTLSSGLKIAPYAVQVVQDKYEIEELHSAEYSESIIVFIGRIGQLSEKMITRTFC